MNFTCEIMTLVKTDANRFLLSMSQIDESLVSMNDIYESVHF